MSETVRWGVLGTADISTRVIPAILAARGARLVAVASRDGARARAWATRFGIPQAFDSYEALLASGAVDAVYLPLPNALHAEWTLRALAAGVGVLCEKPLAVTEAEARAVTEAAERHGRPVMEAFMYRFHPQWGLVRRLLAEGAIGALRTLDGAFSFLLDAPDTIVASAALAGGALRDVGCYPVDAACWLLGASPTRVAAFARHSEVDETMVGLLDFPDGTLARFETSIAAAEQHHLELRGTLGSLVLPSPWIPGPGEAAVILRRHGLPDEVHRPEGPELEPYQAEVEHFGALLAGSAAPLIPLAESVEGARVRVALAEAARTGRVVGLAEASA